MRQSINQSRRQQDRAEECRAFAEGTSSQQAGDSYRKLAEAYELLSRDDETRVIVRREN